MKRNSIVAVMKPAFKIGMMLHVPSALLLFGLMAIPIWAASSSLSLSVFKALPIVLAAMGCFAINDCYDFEKDKVNKSYRALPSGVITMNSALRLGCLLEIGSIIIGFLVSSNMLELLFYLIVSIGSMAYSPLLKMIGLIKGFYTAVFVGFPFAFVLSYVPTELIVVPFYFAIVSYVAAKELLMDIWDMKGDGAAKLCTLPIMVGKRLSTCIVFVLQGISVGLFAFAGVGLAYLALSVGSIVVIDVMGLCGRDRFRRLALYLSWLPLVLFSAPIFIG